ncbi:aminotransferase class IV [Candidatus Uhrbacteria bacterium]|nr:aminotransferase class IV [Candidatus Uhrbacteria bacterium]
MSAYSLFSKNGHLLPIDQASVSLYSIEYSYGFGVYETLRVRDRIPYFLAAHAERLMRSARIIGLEHPLTEQFIVSSVKELVGTLAINDAYNIKILLIGGKTRAQAELFILPSAPLFADRKLYRDGVATITASYERMFPQAKTLNMLGSYLHYRKAKQAGCYDALLLDRDGCMLEGTRSNFFLIKDMTVVSPPAGRILEGVTRMALLKLLGKYGYTYKEALVSPAKLPSYDGAFFTNTSSAIMPIRRIDSHAFDGIPEPLQQLMAHYEQWKKDSGGN